jgi:YVTN family beta-propeller protein
MVACAGASAACGDSGPSTPRSDVTGSETETPSDTTDGSACSFVDGFKQPTGHFPIGETFWLPTPGGDCGGLPWRIGARPEGSSAELVEEGGGARFTPDVTGSWVFELSGKDERVTLEVVEREGFEHFNYYPASSLLEIEGDIWTANGWDPSLSRIGPTGDLERVQVGSWPVALAWREGMEVVLVAQRGSDTVGIVDVAARSLVDAIWVGDEPAEIVISPDGERAFVALATENAIAVVDIAKRAVIERVEVVKDPLAMTIVGNTLWVASYRSGQPDRAPFGSDPVETERDLAGVDIETYEVRYLTDVGHTITAIHPGPDDTSLYVAHTRGDPYADFVAPKPGLAAFKHELMVVDLDTGMVRTAVDLGRQATSSGPVVFLRDIEVLGGRVWLSSEGTDEVLGLDIETLEERIRVTATGRPRALLVGGERIYAHGAQSWVVTEIGQDSMTRTLSTGVENRDAAIAEGQRFFTGAGKTYGVHWSCNTCHVDGLSDTLVWKAGPFESRHSPRPLFWLEATMPLGWDGYSASARNFAHSGPVNIGVKPTSSEALALTAYLESIMPPPPANGLTRRDGSMTAEAELGEAVFEEAGCTACHGGALTTNRRLLEEGITEGLSDVPSLIASYRHVAWLKHGDAITLEAAVEAAVDAFSDAPLPEADLELLTRYVAELTARDFTVIAMTPAKNELEAAVDRPVQVAFSTLVLNAPENLSKIRLVDDSGVEVDAQVSVKDHRVTLAPSSPLAHSSRYEVQVESGFMSTDEREARALTLSFSTAAAPSLAMAGEYRWVVSVPFPDFANGRFDNSRTVAVTTPLTVSTPGVNPELVFDFGDELTYTGYAVVSAADLIVPGVPVPAGTALGDSRGLRARLVDLDADGVADEASGSLTLTGPGFVVEGVAWRLIRPPVTTGCPEGPGGDVPVTVTFTEEGQPVVSWDPSEGNALAVYVTDPNATLPILPGQVVTDGAAYWALSAIAFPAGFPGPVTYGVVAEGAEDASTTHGAPLGGAPLEAGRCYQLSVTSNKFETGFVVLRYPTEFAR